MRTKCLRNPDKTEARQVSIVDRNRPGSLTDEMRNKIDTSEGRKMYSKRLGIVEPVFGNIRASKKMDKFTLRGKIKVNIQLDENQILSPETAIQLFRIVQEFTQK